jgi:ATP-dependent protease ClpP protease subunit
MKTRKHNSTLRSARSAALQPSFKASLQADTLELTIYEEIGVDWWSDQGVSGATVTNALKEAGVFNRIQVRINSPGGDVFEGIAIYNILRAQKKPIDVFVDGIAASAASVIAMAGDTITMGTAAMMMIHNAWTIAMGDAREMRKTADLLDAIGASIGECYTKKSGKTAAEVQAIMDAETWLSGQQCVDEGFATAIASEDDEESAMALARSFKGTAKLPNLPQALKKVEAAADDTCKCTCGPCGLGDCANCDCSDDDCESCAGEDADCVDCGGNTVEDSNLSQYEARLALLGKPKA